MARRARFGTLRREERWYFPLFSMTVPARPNPEDPDRRPRTLGQRLQLLLILLVLPVAAVTVPTLLVTGIFGQHPRSKASTGAPTPAIATTLNGLGAALNRSAESLLPAPAPLTPEPIQVKVRPDHLTARAEKVSRQAAALGGSAVEGVSNPGEKHLFVDLPAGNADAFRRALADNTLPTAAAAPIAGAARDQLEVIVRPTADDE